MQDPRLINERRHRLACRAAMEKLASDDGSLMGRALDNIAKWERDQVCHKWYVQRWREILGSPLTDARELVLAETPEAIALRQNHPFAGFFSESERQSLRLASVD